MAFLVNRTPAARLQCLHYLTKLALGKFGSEQFRLGGILYDEKSLNIHKFCELLIDDRSFGIKYCPYLSNPLSKSGCYLTKSVDEDTTKKKEVSNSANSLDALGFLKREGQSFQVTDLGRRFANSQPNSEEFLQIIREGILNYGLSIGVLSQLKALRRSSFDTNQIFVGYPDTDEKVKIGGDTIAIPLGSQRDFNTRTRSCLLAWFTAAGYVEPSFIASADFLDQDSPQKQSADYILSADSRNRRKYRIIFLPDVFDRDFVVQRPLDYNNLIKNIRALRENGQGISRQATMQVEHIVKNRRLTILYCLNYAFMKKKSLDFEKLVGVMSKYPKFFIIADNDLKSVMIKELPIASIAGIPFIATGKDLKPLTGLNQDVLCANAPQELMQLIKNNIAKDEYVLSA